MTDLEQRLYEHYKQKFDERRGDMTQDPIDAEHFFDEEESRAEDYDQTMCYLVNFIAWKYFNTLPLKNNPFIIGAQS